MSLEHWTDDASRSCQLILQLNVRTFDVIARQLSSEARRLLDTPPAEVEPKSRKAYFPTTFADTIPLFRVYMAWTYYYRTDLTKYKEHLAPHFDTLCEALGLAMGLLLELAETNPSNAKVVPVLCVEDVETLGMQCLQGSGFPRGCALDCDPVSGMTKSRESDYRDRPVNPEDITFTRLVSALMIAHALRTSGFPVSWPMAPESAGFDQRQNGEQLAALRDTPHVASTQLSPEAPASVSLQNTTDTHVVPELPGSNVDSTRLATDDMDNTVLQMVNDFLAPPEASKSMRLRDDTSYGMGSATAKEVFGATPLPTAKTPTSTTAKALQTLPWDFFPCPLHSDARPLAGTDAGPQNAWNHGLGSGGLGCNGEEASEPRLSRPEQPQHSPQGNNYPDHNRHPQLSVNTDLFNSFPSSLAFSAQGSSLPPVHSPWGVPRQVAEYRPFNYSTPALQGHSPGRSAGGRKSTTNPEQLYDDHGPSGTTRSWGQSTLLQVGSSPLHGTPSSSARASTLVAESAVYNRQARLGAPELEDERSQPLPKPIGTRPDRASNTGRSVSGQVSQALER